MTTAPDGALRQTTRALSAYSRSPSFLSIPPLLSVRHPSHVPIEARDPAIDRIHPKLDDTSGLTRIELLTWGALNAVAHSPIPPQAFDESAYKHYISSLIIAQ